MSKNEEWLQNRIKYIQGLKNPSTQQALLVQLINLPTKTPEQQKQLTALARSEYAADKASIARAKVIKLLTDEKKKAAAIERKARNHRLILQGVLFDLAELENRSRGELLGMLLAGAATTDPQKWQAWKVKGDALLAEKERTAVAPVVGITQPITT
jgi:hypothetical protein